MAYVSHLFGIKVRRRHAKRVVGLEAGYNASLWRLVGAEPPLGGVLSSTESVCGYACGEVRFRYSRFLTPILPDFLIEISLVFIDF